MNRPDGVDAATATKLLDAARAARANAYAPYSGFAVGAAVLDDEGRVHVGVNVENASYGLSTCAERSAVARAVSDGARRLRAVAIMGPEDDVACMPCGSCRQILHELGSGMTVVVADTSGGARTVGLEKLLPGAFDAARLGGGPTEP